MRASVAPGEVALLGLGANLGDPLRQIRDAATSLCGHLEECAVSPVYRSTPEGGAEQPPYLNAVVRGRWTGSAGELLTLARRLEDQGGRTRPFPGAARTLDVDVLFLGRTLVDREDLRIPHPRWHLRSFVVVPLLDVAAGWVDPETGVPVSEVARGAGWSASSLELVARPDELLALETI